MDKTLNLNASIGTFRAFLRHHVFYAPAASQTLAAQHTLNTCFSCFCCVITETSSQIEKEVIAQGRKEYPGKKKNHKTSKQTDMSYRYKVSTGDVLHMLKFCSVPNLNSQMIIPLHTHGWVKSREVQSYYARTSAVFQVPLC